jgi:hypothetical protein
MWYEVLYFAHLTLNFYRNYIKEDMKGVAGRYINKCVLNENGS